MGKGPGTGHGGGSRSWGAQGENRELHGVNPTKVHGDGGSSCSKPPPTRHWQLQISARGHRKRTRLTASTSGFPRLCAHSRTGRGSVESHGADFRGRRPQGTALGTVRGPHLIPSPGICSLSHGRSQPLHPGRAVPAQPEISAWFPSLQPTWGKQRAEALLRGRGAPG